MNYKYRIIIFDEERHDRGLLALALRSSDASLEILEAASALEIAQHASNGPIDALIAEPGRNFVEVRQLAAEIRKRSPRSLLWLFTADALSPSARDCVGAGVDGRTVKTSAGFLSLPVALSERLRAARDLASRFPVDADAVFSGAFAIPACLLGRGGLIVAVNRELELLLERPRYELLDLSFEQLLAEPERQDEWRRRFLATQQRWEFGADVEMSGACPLLAAITVNPLSDVQAGHGLWAVNLFDVSRLLGTHTAATDSRVPPERERDSGLDNLLFAVSHDLQAPLNSMAAHARTLAESGEPGDLESRVAAKEIAALTARMQAMVDGILQVASVRATDHESEIVGLDEVLQDAMDNLRSEIDATGATIERHSLPTLRVNRQQMVQVFQNLLGNALKFRGNRVPRIRVSAEERGDVVRVQIEDNGIGIEAKDIGRVFDMFQRLHSDREYPGIGLGLAVCRQIVRAHGGDITVESTPGRGSCFVIELRGAALRANANRGTRDAVDR